MSARHSASSRSKRSRVLTFAPSSRPRIAGAARSGKLSAQQPGVGQAHLLVRAAHPVGQLVVQFLATVGEEIGRLIVALRQQQQSAHRQQRRRQHHRHRQRPDAPLHRLRQGVEVEIARRAAERRQDRILGETREDRRRQGEAHEQPDIAQHSGHRKNQVHLLHPQALHQAVAREQLDGERGAAGEGGEPAVERAQLIGAPEARGVDAVRRVAKNEGSSGFRVGRCRTIIVHSLPDRDQGPRNGRGSQCGTVRSCDSLGRWP